MTRLHAFLFCGSIAAVVPIAPVAAQLSPNAELSTARDAKPNDEHASLTLANGQAKPESPVSDAELDGNRGGETVVFNTQTLSAATTGNTLNGNYTAGAVTISDNALSNFNGIGNFSINTGAQVSLQSGMNLTINVSQ